MDPGLIGPAPTNVPPVTAAVSTTPTSGSSTQTGSLGGSTIAGNFNTFLTLLTTQLQNQNPLDPLDTNQFTQQLVQFASVEQQINMNTQLGTLISLQQTQQATAALNFVGQTVAIDGSTATLAANGQATWSLSVPKPATATVTITDKTGQTVFTDTPTFQAGTQTYMWDGRDASGNPVPPGPYKISISAADSNGQTVAIGTEVHGTVDSVDVTKNPPVLSVAGQSITLDKVKQIFRSGQ